MSCFPCCAAKRNKVDKPRISAIQGSIYEVDSDDEIQLTKEEYNIIKRGVRLDVFSPKIEVDNSPKIPESLAEDTAEDTPNSNTSPRCLSPKDLNSALKETEMHQDFSSIDVNLQTLFFFASKKATFKTCYAEP